MAGTLFFAGATGAVGRRLLPMLVADGWRVTCATRSEAKLAGLRDLGADAVLADVFDAEALAAAVIASRPDMVMHQLTDLPPGLDPARMAEATARNARIRDEGTRHLLAAVIRAGARRFVAQSVAFAYAGTVQPHRENDPLAIAAEGRAGVSARGAASLERQVLTAPLAGIVLRYGRLYGPGTGFDAPSGPAPLHVDAAARAAALAARHGRPGIYNLAEDDGTVDSEKAKQTLHWAATWRPGS